MFDEKIVIDLMREQGQKIIIRNSVHQEGELGHSDQFCRCHFRFADISVKIFFSGAGGKIATICATLSNS